MGRIPVAEARGIGEPLEAGDEATGQVAVAGRLVARRGQGKTVFADIEDRTGAIQAWATLDRLGEQGLGVLAEAHVGDIIGVRGSVVRTRRGEVSVAADSVEMLAKSLRPPPDRHAGLKDPETRYRQRYLDLMASDEVRAHG
ncbi:MAG: OB-fold nucleic acid binding domain-containing protein [Actinomycetota bacterium]